LRHGQEHAYAGQGHIPDFILGLGFTDDIAVLTAAITTVRAHITPAHRMAAREAIADES